MEATYIDHMGDDLRVVNAARVSFNKESKEFSYRKDVEKGSDEGLISYLASHGHWCYDDKTEIITDKGWKFFKDLDDNDLVGQVSGWEDENFLLEFIKPLQKHRSHFTGEMISCKGKNFNYCVTPRHKMLFKRRHKSGLYPWQIGTSDEFFGKEKRMQQTASLSFNINTKDYASGFYLGFLLGDGSRSTGKALAVRLKRGRKIETFETILEQIAAVYTKNTYKDGVTCFRIEDESTELYNAEGEKAYPIEDIISEGSDYIKGVLDGLLASDGSIKRNTYTFSSSSRALMELFKTLCSLCGEHAIESKPRHGTGSHKLNYRAMLQTRKTCVVNDSRDRHTENLTFYEGEVFCVTVPSGMVLVRREGRQLVCGNTPFSQPQITMREKVPLFVARQRFKHTVGFTYNEVSRRYVDDTPEFFTPNTWRSRPDGSVKQGSGGDFTSKTVWWTDAENWYSIEEGYREIIDFLSARYNDMIKAGIAPEQARMILPQSMYTEYYVTGSLAAWARAYKQRIDAHAQKEIQELAIQWGNLIRPLFPVSWRALIGEE